jgi:hypothetical protein
MVATKTNYKKRTNKRTGELEYSFNALLVSMSDNTIANKETGKLYKIATLKFHNTKGEPVTKSAMCYEASYSQGLANNVEYLTTLSLKQDGNPALLMSHLPASSQSTLDDFEGLFGNDTEE